MEKVKDEVVGVLEMAKRLNISRFGLWKIMKNTTIPMHYNEKNGRYYFYPQEVIDWYEKEYKPNRWIKTFKDCD